MQVQQIADDTFLAEQEYVFLRQKDSAGKTRLLKFSTLPNIFCAQGDGRWWHDHRTPGGIMITSNALGHFVYSRSGKFEMDESAKITILDSAMRTINNAYKGGVSTRGKPLLKHCPATFLLPIKEGEASPLKETSDFKRFSADHYQGYFHTDYLIPSVFFQKGEDPRGLSVYDNLTLRYIYDARTDPDEHRELMTGVDAKWYEVKRDLDRLPSFVDPQKHTGYSVPLRARLAKWLEQRRRQGIESANTES